jgi:hypothetical protein
MQEVLKREKDVIALVAGMVKVDQCWKSSLIGQA